MTHDAAVSKAQEIASRVLAPSAGQNDKAGRFSTEAVASLGEAGLLGLMLPADVGGAGLGPRTLAAVIATLAEADASVGMVYLMHVLGATAISTARPGATQAVKPTLQDISAGRHLSTLAFSEAGSRSHFWDREIVVFGCVFGLQTGIVHIPLHSIAQINVRHLRQKFLSCVAVGS